MSLRILGLFVLLSSAATAQSLAPLQQSALPGGLSTLTFTHTGSGGPISYGNVSQLGLLDREGELVAPEIQGRPDAFATINPNASINLSVSVPSTGPGSFGSYVLYSPLGGGAVARLDVGSPDPSFPSLHAFPANILDGYASHAADYSGSLDVRIANCSVTPVLLTGIESLQVWGADGVSLLHSRLLPLGTIAAGAVLTESVALAGFPREPLTIEVRFPASSRAVRFGISPDGIVDAHFPEARRIASGTTVQGHALLALPQGSAANPPFAFVLGLASGSTPLPAGRTLPLDINDPIVLDSVFTGLGGILTGNLGAALSWTPPCRCLGRYSAVRSLSILHPSLTPLGDIAVRGAVVIDGGSGIGLVSSQPLHFIFE